MGKLKTIKAVAKRIKITKNKKILKKTAGQNHFNARDTGKDTRQKRKLNSVSKALHKNIKNFLPHSN